MLLLLLLLFLLLKKTVHKVSSLFDSRVEKCERRSNGCYRERHPRPDLLGEGVEGGVECVPRLRVREGEGGGSECQGGGDVEAEAEALKDKVRVADAKVGGGSGVVRGQGGELSDTHHRLLQQQNL